MALNTKTEYALRVLLEIQEQGHVSAQKICEAQNLPKKYIEHLMAMLKTAGLVNSSPGSLGGYALAKKPEEISFADVLAAVEDYSFNTACVDTSREHCLGDSCTLSSFFNEIQNELQQVFSSYTLKDILKIWQRKDK
ncbi:MAG: Rrf2 family transcriptional regulator [Candidatus Cloacimonetes bacterium]|jgi:Rrf2 family protein|nr:Rrf2 family transcriptional regulator [Candidatus Cloacimonadota bacterium]MDD2505723.1 Rrf2 family transcriptional regulator [Candidatus Cloacimonadota bacterium]MDD4148347.1 Rrf2 family transcriptional regulator [Candidatus Cloacimonadota bacterium]MDD4559145.1 Rrf2 family transcriptional regulator [Candidatus Cloacimonadota bacterium]